MHLTQECDSYIDLVINGTNILNGYEGSFVYPTYAFLRTLNNGLASVLSKGVASIPIFLQQFSFSEDSPQHRLDIRVNPANCTYAFVTFSWCSTILTPPQLPTVCNSPVLVKEFILELSKNIVRFQNAASSLLAPFHMSPKEVTIQLFSDFSNVPK